MSYGLDTVILMVVPVIVIPICGWIYWFYMIRKGKGD